MADSVIQFLSLAGIERRLLRGFRARFEFFNVLDDFPGKIFFIIPETRLEIDFFNSGIIRCFDLSFWRLSFLISLYIFSTRRY